jgi:hypothetical protein
MDVSDFLREPGNAALFAGAVTAIYIHLKARMNNEGVLPTSAYMKPAVLVALLVYFIVISGVSARETISMDPY